MFVLATRRGKQFNSMVQQDRDPLTGAERDHIFMAEAEGLPLIAPGNGLQNRLQGIEFEWILSIANLDIIPDDVLALAARGAVNFHDGPLPAYAGLNAPVRTMCLPGMSASTEAVSTMVSVPWLMT